MNQELKKSKFIECCSLTNILHNIILKNKELLEVEETKKFASGVQETVWMTITKLQSSKNLCSKCSSFADILENWRNQGSDKSNTKF